ncbi:Vesicular-fusion protein sec18 [Babesia sp. Xinjiang]|uniref:Vesicular-fusion protein sec18 n=1 Tax=Babesia sp. Xinjiang TaxID=462227 RepID=UPI000A265E6A|nr:Vesicular-fusion protein sec18 [Babesia sp. Xinjiang]ORM41001.1 Vesicular-fusion protein sec18 [Babesia sp. Xinjiang]
MERMFSHLARQILSRHHPSCGPNDIFLNSCARQLIAASIGEVVEVIPVSDSGRKTLFGRAEEAPFARAGRIVFEVSFFRASQKGLSWTHNPNNHAAAQHVINFDHLEVVARESLLNHVLHLTQSVAIVQAGLTLRLRVTKIVPTGPNKQGESVDMLMRGCFVEETKLDFNYVSADGRQHAIPSKEAGILKPNFNFEEMGIGGLDNEFADIFRRAFASRIYPPELLKQLGISHVKGMLLYGPPGTGKTLIARQLSKALNCHKPKIVNGPEVMSRFFGQSEENIRNLFKDAEEEYARLGDRSSLHIIIFDEIDSICQRRGTDTSGTGARDSIVNQLLSKIDGIDALNNILLIGMTNRIDMIDEALLRPGRFEVHIEVGLPDKAGRCQILKIHTRVMRESKRLADDVDLDEICALTKNYSGAELEGMVKCAVSYAIQRHVDGSDITKPKDMDKIIVTQADFLLALNEVRPAYGVDSTNLTGFTRHGIVPFGHKFHQVLETCTILAGQVQKSEKTPVLSVLLHGPVGCGKSALAAHVASVTNFPFVKVVSPENYIGLSELARVNAIHKAFDDAHKTPQSLIILDDIERLIDYTPIGPRFSNTIMQCLLILIKKAPKHGRRIFVIGTTSEDSFMEMANVTQAFTVSVEVPMVTGSTEIYQALSGAPPSEVPFSEDEIRQVANCGRISEIGIKNLMLALEIAVQRTVEEVVVVRPGLYLDIRWIFRGMCVAAAATGTVVCLRSPDSSLYTFIIPLIRTYLDPEMAHKLSLTALKLGIAPVDYSVDPPVIQSRIKDVVFFNPIGMAAGYDKHVEAPLEILRLGFGFIELGTVLPLPQEGNPKPVLFRLHNSKALVNRCGFNSVGLDVALPRLRRVRQKQADDLLTKDFMIGVSVGKNLHGDIIADTVHVIKGVARYSDYLALNVSSPNTPHLRDNQRREPLIALINAARGAIEHVISEIKAEGGSFSNTTKKAPLLLIKISPDLSRQELEDIADIALTQNVDGIIATNTTITRPDVSPDELEKAGNPAGGLSGRPLKKLSKRLVYDLYELTEGKVPIIACGGISSAQDALEMIESGATLCQMFTGLVYEGPGLPSRVKNGLAELLMRKGYVNVSEAIGAEHQIWEQRSSTESEVSSDDDVHVKRVPLFDRLLPAFGKSRPEPVSQTSTESESTSSSESVAYESHTESESSKASEVEEAAEYDADWRRLQHVRAANRQSPATFGDWKAHPRAWDSVFYISSMHNLENVEQSFFYCIRVQHVNERISGSSGLGNLTMYTQRFTLKPGEDFKLETPLFIWKKRRLTLPYGQLQHYVIEIELWKTHRLRINSLHASQRITFQDIIERNSNINITLNMYIPNQVAGGTSGLPSDAGMITEASERRYPVHKLSVFLLLEEVFDFFFVFENWWFTMSPELPDAVKELPKTLKISVPSAMGSAWQSRTTGAATSAYWSAPGTFRFQGTLRQLRYASFTAKVYCVHRSRFISRPPALLGTCVLSLKSVQELPLVRGVVKKLTLGTRNMFSGTIQGNIRCCIKSCTVNFFEDLKSRPAQPITGSALITQLDHRCHYLVVRVIRCSSLPASNTDSNTSDPMVKVKWDGIVNCTGVVESTVSPIYNQNMYFPIHLVDNRELTDPALIRHSLPVDMSSKGPVMVEVWDHDDASSEFLGSVEVPLSKLYTQGVLQRRSLVDGIFSAGSYEAEMDDEDEFEEEPTLTYTGDTASSAPYRRHMTRLYEATLPLTGSTVAHRGRKPTVSVEMYILPPMPNDLYIPDEPKKHIRTDIYRDLSRRWTKDFDAWQTAYCDRFPGAIPRRRFTCVTKCAANVNENMQSDLMPLCYFVKPIQVYIQLSPPGELMHWISNFTYKDDGMASIGGRILIESWQMPSRFVLTRKGGLHDRALLLCSCLLGLGYDAYVCKGTLENGYREHCWVMTRHADGTVTFWETANKRMWHLPRRWRTHVKEDVSQHENIVKASGNYAPIQETQQAPEQKPNNKTYIHPGLQRPRKRLMDYELYGNDYVADVKVDLRKIFSGNEFITDANSSLPKQTAFLVDNRQLDKAARRRSTCDPKSYLLVPGETLVYLPYSTLEVVFNDKQVWGNMQSQHPSCITYDLDSQDAWKPFLKVSPSDPIMPDVQITAPAPQAVCVATSREILTDIIEMIELMYAQKGRVANIARDQQMDERLDSLIDLLEFRQRLDGQFDPGMPPHLLGWSTKRSSKIRASNTAGKERAKKTVGENAAESAPKVSLPITVNGHMTADDDKLRQMRSVMETANQLAECIKDKDDDEYDSDETAASTDDSLVFDPSVAHVTQRTEEGNRRNLPPQTQSRPKRTWGLGLASNMKAILKSAPRHNAMPEGNLNTAVSAPVPRYSWYATISHAGFRLRKSSVKINVPQLEIMRVLSNASEHLVTSNVEELSDYRYEVEAVSSPKSEGDADVPTPLSAFGDVIGPLPWNHPLSDYKQCITSAVHLKAPAANNNRQQPRGIRLPAASGQRQGKRIAKPRRNLLGNLLNRFRSNDVPEAHTLPQFMADMQSVVNERKFTPQYMEHRFTIPNDFRIHESKQISKWNWYYNMEARQFAWRRHLPIPPNHTFIGVPIHFSTSDINEIRHLLDCSKRCKKLLVPDVERCVNVVYVKVFPLVGGVFSTWIFLGCHVPWNLQ